MWVFLRPAKWNFFALPSLKRTSRTAKGKFKELIFSLILVHWDIYIAKSLQPKKVIVLDNNDCCKGWTLNGTLQKDFSSAIFAEPKPFCKVPLRVHPLPHSFLSTKITIFRLKRLKCNHSLFANLKRNTSGKKAKAVKNP